MKILDIIYQDKGFIKIKSHSQKEMKEAYAELVAIKMAMDKSKALIKKYEAYDFDKIKNAIKEVLKND